MDLSGLTSVTNALQMNEWLTANMVTPVTPAISASDMATILQKIIDILQDPELVLYAVQTADHTLALGDTAVDMSLSSENTVTIPSNASVAFPVGTQILLTQSGTGQTTVIGGQDVTINSTDGLVSLKKQYSGATLIKRATDVWWLYGDLAATEPPPVPTEVKINLTNTEIPATSPGWNNFNYDAMGTMFSLETTTGTPSGISIVAAPGTTGSADWEHNAGVSFGNGDFPDDVLSTLWYLRDGTNLVFTVSGLTVNQQYTVKVCAADNGPGDGQTKFTVGYSSQLGADPNNVAVELTFTNVYCASDGTLGITIDNTASATNPLLNAIIITQD